MTLSIFSRLICTKLGFWQGARLLNYASSVTTQQTCSSFREYNLKSKALNLLLKTFITFMALFAGNIKALLGKWLLCLLPGFQWDQILSGLTYLNVGG